jgi:hypothetical protein
MGNRYEKAILNLKKAVKELKKNESKDWEGCLLLCLVAFACNYIWSVQCGLLKLSNTLSTSALRGPMTSKDEHVVLLRVFRVLLAQSECFYGVLSGFAAQPSGLVLVSHMLGGWEIPDSDSVTLLVIDKTSTYLTFIGSRSYHR